MGKDVIDLRAGHIGYKGVADILSYGVNSYEVSVNANKVISGELLEGQVNSSATFKLSNSTRLFSLDAGQKDTELLNTLIFFLKAAYSRAVGEEPSTTTLQEILASHTEEAKTAEGTVAHDATIEHLKSHISELSTQLADA